MTGDAAAGAGTVYGVPPAAPVGTALQAYFAANGFDVATYDAARYEVDLAEVTGDVWTFPNSSARRRAVPLHDLHHVLTNYGTDVMGEAEIAAWELVAGCNSLFLWWISLSAVFLGLLLSPGRVLRAAVGARRQRSLYGYPLEREALLELSVAELRSRLKLRPEGQAEHPPRLHRRAPGPPTAPAHTLPRPVRRLLRLASVALGPAFGGARASP